MGRWRPPDPPPSYRAVPQATAATYAEDGSGALAEELIDVGKILVAQRVGVAEFRVSQAAL